MQISLIPAKLQKLWAVSGTKNTIPVDSQIGITPGAASLTDGFPPLTMTPMAAGGVSPYGADFNGILNWLSAIAQWSNAGGQYPYDAAYSALIGGYPKGALLLKADGTGCWLSLADNNATNPETGGAGWTTAGGIPLLASAPTSQVTGTNTIFVQDRQQILIWQTIGTFTGYASAEVGCWSWGTQPNPRPFETDLIGQTLDKTVPKYAALYAWANAAGLFVSSGAWVAGTYFFCEMGGNLFRVPDMRNMFLRATGTDADTANARALGSTQLDALQNVTGRIGLVINSGSGPFVDSSPQSVQVTGGSSTLYTKDFDLSLAARTSTETRSPNTALNPRTRL